MGVRPCGSGSTALAARPAAGVARLQQAATIYSPNLIRELIGRDSPLSVWLTSVAGAADSVAHGRVFPAVSLQGSGNAFASVAARGQHKRGARAAEASIGDFAVRIAAPAARPVADARGAAGGGVAWRARRVLSGHSHMPKSVAPGPVRAASGPRAAIGPRPPPQTPSPTTLRRSRTTGPPHRSPSPTAPRSTPSSSTSRHRPIRSPFRTGPPSRSPIRYRPVPRFCPPSRSTPAPQWRSAMALLPKSRRLPVAATSLSVPPIPPPP